jgi:uncharacterized protein YceH (UPF0502 family)
MEFVPTAIGVLLVGIAAAFALVPFARGAGDADEISPTLPAQDERMNIYQQVLELELDQELGKLSDEDYRSLSSGLLAQASVLLREERGATAALDDELEQEIAAARAAFAAARKRTRRRVAGSRS